MQHIIKYHVKRLYKMVSAELFLFDLCDIKLCVKM